MTRTIMTDFAVAYMLITILMFFVADAAYWFLGFSFGHTSQSISVVGALACAAHAQAGRETKPPSYWDLGVTMTVVVYAVAGVYAVASHAADAARIGPAEREGAALGVTVATIFLGVKIAGARYAFARFYELALTRRARNASV